MGETITFRCPDGSEASGYLAVAEGATSGTVVLQEWWGLNDQIRGVADRFAAAGITAMMRPRPSSQISEASRNRAR